MDMPFAFDDRQTAFYGLKQGSSSANWKMTLALLVRNGALCLPTHGALGVLDQALQHMDCVFIVFRASLWCRL